MELADEGGIKALSMRKLAQELGVEAMSLYNHVANKDDLLDGIVELVASKVDLATDDADWKTAIRRRSTSAHDLFSRHKWALNLWMSSSAFGPSRMRFADSTLRSLREAGFSNDLTYHGFHVLQAHVMGYTLQEANLGFNATELKKLAASFLREFPTDEYPDLAEHVREHMEPREGHQGAFEFGLDLILDSLERLRDGP
jgi:AcrR family transcriptional regulator